MAHLYKVSEWETSSGHWYCNDVTDLAGLSAKWWIPARILEISLTDYILLLKNTFNAKIMSYTTDTDVLIFYWDNYANAHKYVLYINKIAKQKNFVV